MTKAEIDAIDANNDRPTVLRLIAHIRTQDALLTEARSLASVIITDIDIIPHWEYPGIDNAVEEARKLIAKLDEARR